DGRFPRFRIQALQEVRGVVPRFALHLPDEELLGFVGRQARHALELALLLRDELFVFPGRRGRRLLALGDGFFAGGEVLLGALVSGLARRQARLTPGQRLLELRSLLAVLPCLLLGTGDNLVRLLLGVEQGLLFPGFGVALSFLDEAGGALFGTADRVSGD